MSEPAGPETATILFTDMVGSTAQRVELGEERADRLREVHDALLIERAEAHRGRVVKGGGDGLLVVFDSATDALAAAVAMQQCIDAHNRRPDSLARIRIRIGISTGDVTWDRGDCFGLPVVEAARLEAAANPGQILCTDFVRVMARGRGGHEFQPIGELDLKGIPEPLPAAEVIWRPDDTTATIPLPPALAVEYATPLVGRSDELAAIDAMISGDAAGPIRSAWLLGEPGIGKTRLAAEVARTAHAAGTDVLFGRCDEDLSVPYQPFIEALRWFADHVPDDELSERLGADASELARLLPELLQRVPGLEPPPPAGAEIGQYRLYEAVRRWLAAASATRRVLLVVDDAHWASPPTLQLLAHLVRAAEASGAAFLVTARDTQPDRSEPLDDIIGFAERQRRGGRLAIGGLARVAVAELVGERRAAVVHEETAGNPLFVQALAAARPYERLPGDIQSAARHRISRLPEGTQELLRAASVMGLDVDLRVVTAATDSTDLDALGHFELATAANVIQEVGPNTYRWTHALIRSALRGELSRSRQVRFHARIARAIETVHSTDLAPYVAQLAYHYDEAIPVLGPHKALEYAQRAGEHAAGVLSHEEAARYYRRALELLPTGEDASTGRAELLVAQGVEERRSGNVVAALETLERAAELATALRAGELLARTGIEYEDAIFWPGLPGQPAVDILERALGLLGGDPPGVEAQARASLGRALEFTGQFDAALTHADHAVDLARTLGDRRVLVHALARRLAIGWNLGDIDEKYQLSKELFALATPADGELYMYAWIFRSWFAMQAGQPEGYALCNQTLEVARRQVGDVLWVYTGLAQRLAVSLSLGRFDDAERAAEEAMELGASIRGEDPSGVYGIRMFAIRREQGRLGAIEPLISLVVARAGNAGIWRPGLALLYAELGMEDDARRLFEQLTADNLAAIPHDGMRHICLYFLADTCAMLDDRERAAQLAPELEPLAGYYIMSGGSGLCFGAAARYVAMVLTTARRFDEAEPYFTQAVDVEQRLGARPWLAHTRYQQARMLELRRGPGDAEDAARCLAEAAELATACGQMALIQRIERLRTALPA